MKKFELNAILEKNAKSKTNSEGKSKKSKNSEECLKKESNDLGNIDERIISLNKLGLVLLIPFLKDSSFYAELLNVLETLFKLGEDWQRGYCELNMEIFKIGNSKNLFNLKYRFFI